MEPGEGSAAPKATVALPGTDVNLAGRAPARLAVHCSLATGGPGAAMRHAPFGRPRHPLGTFPCGKVPRPPAGGRNLPQETDFLWEAGKGPFLLFPYHRGFRLCGGDQRAFRSPFGNLRHLCSKGVAQKTDSLWKARKSPSLLLPVLRRISPLRRRPKGFPIALWKPSGPCCKGVAQKNRFLVDGKRKALPCFFLFRRGFRTCGCDQGAFRSPPGTLRECFP